MLRDQQIFDDASANQVILDDALERRRIARAVPRSLWIHDRDRAALADAQAVRLGPQNAALVGKTQLFEARLEEIPRGEAARYLAALRLRLIAAEENVPPRDRHADRFRYALL